MRPIPSLAVDPFARVRWLSEWASESARDERVRRLARALAVGASDDTEAAARILAAVQRRVRFERDPSEATSGVDTYQGPLRVWWGGVGDCDDVAPLLAALFRSVGLRSAVVGMRPRRARYPAHVSAMVWVGGAWRWAEGTVGAKLGEHPTAAARRLKHNRKDLV